MSRTGGDDDDHETVVVRLVVMAFPVPPTAGTVVNGSTSVFCRDQAAASAYPTSGPATLGVPAFSLNPAYSPPPISRRRSRRSSRASRPTSGSSRCSAPPAPARPSRWRDDRAAAAPGARDRPQQDPCRPALQRVPRVLPATRRSSTSSPTTTTTSPRPTSRPRTSTSRRTRRSTTRSTACATRRPPRSSRAAT